MFSILNFDKILRNKRGENSHFSVGVVQKGEGHLYNKCSVLHECAQNYLSLILDF